MIQADVVVGNMIVLECERYEAERGQLIENLRRIKMQLN